MVVVSAVTAVALVPSRQAVIADADVAMLYLGAIVVVALRSSKAASAVAAALSVAAFNFFYVEPWYTFAVAQSRHLLTFITMFVVGIVLSTMAHRQREQATERSRLLDEARELALRRRTDDMRSALLSAVSHDLRTPLGTITGAATTLRDAMREDGDRLPPAERRALLDDIASEGFRLARLVSSLLDMSRVDAGAIVVKREWLPVEDVLGPALAVVEPRLSPRVVKVEVDPDVPFVFVDPVLFEQVIVNLLENAARHTPPTAEVSIRVHRRGLAGHEVVDIVVADTGPGLPAGVDVFERFVRGGAGGIGLGLAICRGLVQAHGGTVTASTDGGCVVTVTIPGGLPPTPGVPVEQEAR